MAKHRPGKEEPEFPEEIVAPLLATAAAVLMYVAINDKTYRDFVKWSHEHVEAPPGFETPEPPSQKSLVMGASMLVQLATSNMTEGQATYLQMAKIIAEGGFN